jgi:transcriptional regulator GlxA family with amidase domain
MLRRHFRCELRFDAPHDLMVFDEVAQDDRVRTLADEVRAALRETICGGRPAVAKVAKSLGMSARTMQRRLGELGTTYQDVLEDVRRRSARRLLADTDLDMGEVAFLVGFEEVSSFVRAFHVWEGTAPAKWRERAVVRGGKPRGRGLVKAPRRAARVRGRAG